ncbi:MAG: hypothetical protein ABJA61_02280 [Caldimonas sp.]
MAGTLSAEIAVAAARLIVEEGMEYGAAKRRAARDLRRGSRSTELPGNDEIEDEVRAYLDLFHADSQPAELAELRRIAATWMDKLAGFRPHLTGAVWRGTATQRNAIHLDLFCDDSKSAELALIDMHVDYDVTSRDGQRGRVLDVLNVFVRSQELGGVVGISMTVFDYDDLRGALRRDGRGRSERGDLAALRTLQASA